MRRSADECCRIRSACVFWVKKRRIGEKTGGDEEAPYQYFLLGGFTEKLLELSRV
jgi:hypothetical protein